MSATRENTVLKLPHPRKVLVAVRMGNATGRQRLRGIYRYLAEQGDWDVQLVRSESELDAAHIVQACSDGVEGFLVCFHPNISTTAALVASNRPVAAFLDTPASNPSPLFLRLPDENNVLVGETAARHFLSLGRFRSFGFVPDVDNLFWSHERQKGFQRGLDRRAHDFHLYVRPSAHGEATDLRTLTEWLATLPKPSAIMAAWDYRAAQVLSACRDAGLSVPSQVAVIGVDDEEFICEGVVPHLSSVRVDRDGQGFAAAAALDRLLTGQRRTMLDMTPFRGVRLVVRGSTAPLAPSAELVTRALTFIGNEACTGITVNDVARHLGVSRRLADLRFHELGLGGIAENIRLRQLETARHLIYSTHQSLAQIAAACGFANTDSLRNLLRREFGHSIRKLRGDQPFSQKA